MSATIVRAKMLADDDIVEGTRCIDLADLFCRGARRRVDALFHDLFRNDDATNYAAAMRVLDGAHDWVEEGILDPYGLGSTTGAPDTASSDVEVTEPRIAAASG
jgi:hypothetical protein